MPSSIASTRPASRLVATIPVGLAPKGVLATDAAVWVADTHDGKVYRIDPTTNKIVATITVGPTGTSGPNWLGSGLGSIWVDIPNNQTVVRIDAVTNAIQATIRIPDVVTPCGGFAVTSTAVWNTSCDGPQGMTRIDPVTNTVVTAVKLDQQGYNPSVIEGVPWMSIYTGDGNAGRLGRISSATNAVDFELAPGPDLRRAAATSSSRPGPPGSSMAGTTVSFACRWPLPAQLRSAARAADPIDRR